MPGILGCGIQPEIRAPVADRTAGNAALEVYSAGDMQSPDYACGIWVPIVRPQQTADDSAETAVAAALLGLL